MTAYTFTASSSCILSIQLKISSIFFASLQEEPPSVGEPEAEPLADELMSPASSSKHIRSLIMKLSPTPKSTMPRVRKHKAESAALITGSPFKKMLEEKEWKKTSSLKTCKVALELAASNHTVNVIGNDTDILVMLLHHYESHMPDIYNVCLPALIDLSTRLVLSQVV